MRLLLGSVLIFVASLAAIDARAGDGRIPISGPTTITSQGHYVLTGDIAGTIRIEAPDVVLDLDGHAIGGPIGLGDIGIYVVPVPGVGVIEIKNGRLRGSFNKVLYFGDPVDSPIRLRLEGLDLTGTSSSWNSPVQVLGAPIVEIIGCTIHDWTMLHEVPAIRIDSGIYEGFVGVIAGNTVRSVPQTAIEIRGMLSGVVRDNNVTNFGTVSPGVGIFIDGVGAQPSAVILERNTIQAGGTANTGLFVQERAHRNALIDNVITGGGTAMVIRTDGNRIAGNVIGATGSYALLMEGIDNTVERNVIESGAWTGIASGPTGNIFDANSIQGHLRFGIDFFAASDNAYRGNMLRNNVFGAVSGSATDAGGNIP